MLSFHLVSSHLIVYYLFSSSFLSCSLLSFPQLGGHFVFCVGWGDLYSHRMNWRILIQKDVAISLPIMFSLLSSVLEAFGSHDYGRFGEYWRERGEESFWVLQRTCIVIMLYLWRWWLSSSPVTNFDCVAFGRDAVYVYMKFPARADVCRSFKRSEDLFGPEGVSARCVS